MFGSFFLLAALALPGAATHPSIQIVPPDPGATQNVAIVGATDSEVAATRAALARLGRNDPVRRVEFGRQGKGRSITAVYSGSRASFQSSWLAGLFLDDVGTVLTALGEKITWVELSGPDGFGTAFEQLTTPTLGPKGLRRLAHRIAARAHAQHQPVTEIVGCQVAGGAVRVVIELSRQQYLLGTNTRWLDVVPDRFDPEVGYSADVLVLGPGGVRAAEGANYGSIGGAFAYGPTRPGHTAPLDGPVSLRVTIHRNVPRQTRLTFALDCAQASARCTAFRRDWTLLVPPVVAGTVCSSPFGADTITVSGSVAGVPIQREYGGCYSGVVQGWEKVLGVAPSRR